MVGDEALLARVESGDRAALARLCRRLEEGLVDVELRERLLGGAEPETLLGVTGSPGVGKSSLVSRLIGAFRARGLRVGVVAVDPTSPWTGGALLGDRIRMQEHTEDPEVFIRSLATRGAQGGVADATAGCVAALAAWGAQVVLVETVGVGQSEFAIEGLVDTVLLVLAPGLGDEVQAAKAGILEIAHVLVVNKADRPEAARTVAELEAMLALGDPTAATAAATGHAASVAHPKAPRAPADGWSVTVLACSAERGTGVDALVATLERRRTWLQGDAGRAARRSRKERSVLRQLQSFLLDAFERGHPELLRELSREVAAGALSRRAALDRIAREVGGG